MPKATSYILQQRVSKQMVIGLGMNYLQNMGSDSICNVCISYGGSCCSGCNHLSNGVGCTLRNTSCTAWLCGFLKYVLYETNALEEWNNFWSEVPGQDHRRDFTPDHFYMESSLHVQSFNKLSEALAADLQELAQTHIVIGFIFSLREKIDNYIDQYMLNKDGPAKQNYFKKKIANLSSPFRHFHLALSEYNQSFE